MNMIGFTTLVADETMTSFVDYDDRFVILKFYDGQILRASLEAALDSEGIDKPESTEGGRRVSVLKRQEGAPVNLG